MSSTRRDFLTVAGIAVPAAALAPGLARAKPRRFAIPLDKAPSLKKVGGWTVLSVKSHKILFIRISEEEVRAFDPRCTHRGCIVGYDPGDQLIECPCHGSRYGLKGKVKRGPAPRPLTRYQTWLQKGRVIVEVTS